MSAIAVTYLVSPELLGRLVATASEGGMKSFLRGGPDTPLRRLLDAAPSQVFDGSGWTFNPTLTYFEERMPDLLRGAREHPLAAAFQ